MKIKIHNIAIHQSNLISIHMQYDWWGSLKYKRKVTKKVQLNFWLLICHKKWGAFEVEIFLFFKSDLFSVNHRFFNLTGLEKTKEDDVPQNDCEKDAATDPIAGNVIVCFVT